MVELLSHHFHFFRANRKNEDRLRQFLEPQKGHQLFVGWFVYPLGHDIANIGSISRPLIETDSKSITNDHRLFGDDEHALETDTCCHNIQD